MGKPVSSLGREQKVHRDADDRLRRISKRIDRRRAEKGEKKQAIGRSRGGRNTKIHALADAKGRLIAILLTGGEAHDCPVAEVSSEERIRRNACSPTRPTAAAQLREELQDRGTRNQAGHFQPEQQKTTVYVQQAPLPTTMNDRECFQRGQLTVFALPGSE
jgi:hypothetical protein